MTFEEPPPALGIAGRCRLSRTGYSTSVCPLRRSQSLCRR
jgi:hypothetical protein